MKRTGDLVLADVTYSANLRLPRHVHERPYFCLIRRGTYSERYGRRSRSCGPAMVVYHPAGEPHCQEMHGCDVASFNVEIGPSWQQRMNELGIPGDQPVEFDGGPPEALALRMLDELDHDDAGSSLAIENLFWELITAIHNPAPGTSKATPPAWLEAAREMLDTRLQEPLSLGTVADEIGVHPVHLATTFRRHLGCSVGEYLRRRRVEAARARLEDPEPSLTEIAIDVGFADQSHFTRTFKRLTGMTPGQYRAFLPFKTP